MAVDQPKVLSQLCKALQDGGTDGELLERFAVRREGDAFEALVRRHGPMVLGVCRRVLKNAHDAEDAFQATFFVLVRKAASLVPRETLANWLYGVAYHTALKAWATAMKRKAKETAAAERCQPAATTEDAGADWQPLLDQALNRLPDKYREAVVLCDLEGKTRKEAARQLRVPEGTVSGRLTTAHRILARRLARHGLAVSGGTLSTVICPATASAALPAPLVAGTVEAALALAAGSATVSAPAAALADAVLRSMTWAPLKVALAFIVLIGIAGLGTAALIHWNAAPAPATAGDDSSPEADLEADADDRPAAIEPDKKLRKKINNVSPVKKLTKQAAPRTVLAPEPKSPEPKSP